MESRKSSRLRLAVNDSGKQRLTRFIKRNLDLIESNVCLKRANSVKNYSRRNSNETPRSQERANYSTKKEDSTEPLRISSSSEIPDLTKRKSDFLNKPDKNSIKTESKWVSSESSEPLKNVRKPLRKPTAIPPPEKLNSSTRPAWRLVSDGSSRNKDRTLNNTILSKRKAHPSAGNLKQKDGKAGMPSRQSDLAIKKMDVSSIASNSSGRRVIEPEESKSYPIVSNSRSKYIQIQIDSDSNSPTRNMIESSIRTSSFAGNAFVTANTSNSSIRNVEVLSRKSSSSSVNALTSSKKFPQTSSSAEGTSISAKNSNSPADNSESDSEALELKSESSSRKPDSPATISTGPSEELKSFAKSNSPAANSVILITDSDSCSVNAVDSSQSESYDSSLRDSDEDRSKSDPSDAKPLSPNKSVDFTKPDSNAFSNRLDSLLRKSSAPSGKPAASKKKPDSPTKSECTAAPIPFNSPREPLDLHSKITSDIEEPDLGLDTLKRTMVELFTSGDSFKTLPFINRNWPEKSSSCQTKILPSPKNKNPTDERPSADFLSLIDLKTNRYYVQCQLDEVERETMDYMAKRWNWARDPELFPDTKYIIVKEESFNEDFDGIPVNILQANAFGGCVLLFKYVQECAAEDELLLIKERHIPSHEGARRKMLGRYRLTPMFDGFAFFITPEISGNGRHERDFALLRNLLRLTRSKLCSTLDELRKSPETNKVALRSTARSELEGVEFVHYHWLYECILYHKLYPTKPYTFDFTVY